jgi:hypothetical protein
VSLFLGDNKNYIERSELVLDCTTFDFANAVPSLAAVSQCRQLQHVHLSAQKKRDTMALCEPIGNRFKKPSARYLGRFLVRVIQQHRIADEPGVVDRELKIVPRE